jgi:transcriptional antiterminator RfaH
MWSVARVKTNQDHVAIRRLGDQGYQTFNPTYVHRVVVRRKVVERISPLFPTYLFIRLDAGQRWAAINSTYGVLKLLTRMGSDGYNEPCRIQDDFVAGLKRCCENSDALRQRAWMLKPGTTVRILNGPFTMHEGVVSWATSQRVQLLIYMLNRIVPVEVSVAELDAPS